MFSSENRKHDKQVQDEFDSILERAQEVIHRIEDSGNKLDSRMINRISNLKTTINAWRYRIANSEMVDTIKEQCVSLETYYNNAQGSAKKMNK